MRHWIKPVSGALGLALLLTAASVAQAQSNSASLTAQANILSPISVSADNPLNFGDVFPGVAESVLITDVAFSGRWSMTGASSAEVDLSFVLPSDLSDGTNNLPISFGAADGGYNTANDAATATTFDPGPGATTNLSGAGALWVWIGGTVTPAINQPANLYQGTITMTVDYTGN